ncbi:hypothetical protein Acr_03g0006760 [Actinidia rufa]|uniref:Uncharacterized protein n=1 Tax=Actinidia rufa TaxID=165716 RepID=A0A7J0EC57_9ERIC|nr:hypothetical protein Acr_03g0006760 [Actinidia rufa]
MNTIFTLLLFFHIFPPIYNGDSVVALNSLENIELDAMAKRACAEKIGECEELLMDSEINRRVLVMQKKYISYDTLKRDLVPCNTPGASYYDCKAGGEGHPYNRGCEVIARCARSTNNNNS